MYVGSRAPRLPSGGVFPVLYFPVRAPPARGAVRDDTGALVEAEGNDLPLNLSFEEVVTRLDDGVALEPVEVTCPEGFAEEPCGEVGAS